MASCLCCCNSVGSSMLKTRDECNLVGPTISHDVDLHNQCRHETIVVAFLLLLFVVYCVYSSPAISSSSFFFLSEGGWVGEKREQPQLGLSVYCGLAVPALAHSTSTGTAFCLPSFSLSLLIVATCAPLYCATVRHVTHS